MHRFFRRIDYLLHRRRFDRELAGDMEFHREMAARAGNSQGSLANTLLLREQSRDAWGWTWIDRLSQDLRYAARMLRRSPGFTFAAVLMLALGIGVNVACFGLFDVMFLRPLPVRDPATILRFERSAPDGYADNFMYPEVAFYREHARNLASVLAAGGARLELGGGKDPVNASFVTANFLSDLGARAELGRILAPALDEVAGAAPAIVLQHRFWERQFASDPGIVGRTIRLNGQAATVVGVARNGFSGLGWDAPDLWAPIVQQPAFLPLLRLTDFSDHGIGVLMWGRLRPGVSPTAASEELRSLAAELHRQHPRDVWNRQSLPAFPGAYAHRIRHEMIPVLAIAGAMGLLILMTACGSLGSLQLARGSARRGEIAIRVAIGAGRARLVRQLLTESLLLALLGALAGLAAGYFGLRVLMVWVEAPAWLNPAPDWRVLLFAVSVGFAAAILFGLTPAWQASRQHFRATRMRQILIGAQVAGSCVLLIVAGLLARAANQATHADPGFDYKRIISIDPALSGYDAAAARAYFASLEGRLRAIPGVESIALVSNPPLGNRWTVFRTEVAGHAVNLHVNHIDPAFLHTLRIPLIGGHNLQAGDTRSIIVSESLAKLQWPSGQAAGQVFPLGDDRLTVAGVAGSARLVSPEDSDAVEVYQLAAPDLMPSMVVMVRTTAPPEELLGVVATVAKSIDPRLAPQIQLMKTAFHHKVRIAESITLAVGFLGSVALLLACAGIAGLVGFAVSQRTREIGVRMALGAEPRHILGVVLRQFARPVALGLLVGAGGAVALSGLLRGQLYGISNLDAKSYLAAVAIFTTTATAAALWPARRALRVDPIRALRQD